jgi:enamine deaminase RidA (YjgF/YER057c/UK114 family)
MARIAKVTSPASAEPPPGLFSQALLADGTLYVSGQHAGAPGGGVLGDGSAGSQARETFKKIRALVEAAGGRMADVVKLTVYLTDIADRPAVSATRREFFAEPFPTSTLVEIKGLVDPALKVEVEAVAVIGAGTSGKTP